MALDINAPRRRLVSADADASGNEVPGIRVGLRGSDQKSPTEPQTGISTHLEADKVGAEHAIKNLFAACSKSNVSIGILKLPKFR